MLKVLIADDEKKVCQLIANLIDWEALGFEIAGVVNDGISAYRFIQENTVNLMITDIRMPGCDGMELIQKVKVLYPNMYIVIISGYSQFDYAQNAIRYGVEDYLLKPIRKKDLMATLQKILDRYKEEIRDARKWQDIQKRLEENVEKVKRSLLEDLLKRPEKFGGFFIREKINTEYHYQFVEGYYQTLIVKLIPVKRKEDADTRRILLQKGIELLKESLQNVCNETVLNIIDGEIYGLFNGTEDELRKTCRRLKKVKLDLIRLQDVFDELQVYLALGKCIESIQQVLLSFDDARAAMQDRFYFADDFLLKREEKGKSESAKYYIDNTFKKRFLNYIEIMDIDNIRKELEVICGELKESPAKDGTVVGEVYREILTLFYFGIHSYNISIPDQYAELQKALELFGSIDKAMDYLTEYIVNSLMHWIAEKKYVEARPIRIAKRYISDNYYKPLTLEMVSKEIGFNATYFSSMFKKETDMNFSEYLKKIRIDNAKNLLLNTENSVEDISYAVGYSDIKYFSRLFKKLTGVTPTEFRKLYN
ncbi:MAG: response regulator [Dorea sp.]|nr:response regulator [Dorea sp.]